MHSLVLNAAALMTMPEPMSSGHAISGCGTNVGMAKTRRRRRRPGDERA
jgi:hypothetical protein